MARVEAKLAKLEDRLADNSLYEPARKTELDELLREQGQWRAQAGELEETWLEFQHELEELESEEN